MKNIINYKSVIAITLLALPLLFSNSAFSAASDPVVILDNTGGSDPLGLTTDLITKNSQDCTRSKAIKGECNGVRFSSGKGSMQVIQNDSSETLTNYVGLQNAASISTGNEAANSVNKTKPLNLFPKDGSHLFPLETYRKAADAITNLTTNLPDGTYGTISFKKFVENVASSTPMYGIVRVKVPLHREDAKSRYRFCGEKDCPGQCGPTQVRALKPGETVCGHKITSTSKINIYGTLMLDFIDTTTGNEPLGLLELRENDGLPRHLWYCLAVPVNVNPANLSEDSSFMRSILGIKNLSGSNACATENCVTAVSSTLPFSLIPKESKSEYLYKIGATLNELEFNKLPKDEQFNLMLPSGYPSGWKTAFEKLNISSEKWASYGFKVPSKSSDGTDTPISEADVRSSIFEDMPAIISTGGVFSMAHRTNISGLIYAPEAFELLQMEIDNKLALQYINGAVLVKNGFYIGATGENGSITIMSNNANSYSNIQLNPGSSRYGKVTKTSNKSASSTAASSNARPDNNGNLPAPNIFSPPINNTTNPGRQWIEIKPN